MNGLFEEITSQRSTRCTGYAPLADRMRPVSLEEFVGQEEIIGNDKPLRQILQSGGEIPSLILWGPPGSGKTTLAHIIAKMTNHRFIAFSAVTSGVKEVREIVEAAKISRQRNKQGTILFVDEIHRFSKVQQDAFLPHVEAGTITLIGATTENPSFEVVSPLLSRCRVLILRPLTNNEIELIIKRAIVDEERGLGSYKLILEPEALVSIVNIANGDARVALNLLEMATFSTKPAKDGMRRIPAKTIENIAQKKVLLYDRAGEEHYNLISALHKSIRGSDPDAALYWLARMLEAGEDPLYIARRLIRAASEDIGNADPQALCIAVAAKEAAHFVGMPECNLALAQAAIYLATAPKSNAVYEAYSKAQEDIQNTLNEPVPLHLRNPVTKLMRESGYGNGYKYPHSYSQHFVAQEYMPQSLKGRKYYKPAGFGFEREIKKRMEWWEKKRREKENEVSPVEMSPFQELQELEKSSD